MGLLDETPTKILQTAYRLGKHLLARKEGSSVFVTILRGDGASYSPLTCMRNAQTIHAGQVTAVGPPPEVSPIHEGALFPRDGSVCAHAILTKTGMDVPDAHKDWRFCDNPFVKAGYLTAYHGQPLIVRRPRSHLPRKKGDTSPERQTIGTVCVMNVFAQSTPYLDDESVEMLRDLSAIISRELEAASELRQAGRDARMRACTAALLERSTVRTKTSLKAEDATFFDEMAQSMRDVVDHVDFFALLDMRNAESPLVDASAALLGYAGKEMGREDFMAAIAPASRGQTLRELIRHCREGTQLVYNSPNDVASSPLAPFCSATSTCAACIPLFSPDGEFLFLLLTACSIRAPHCLASPAMLTRSQPTPPSLPPKSSSSMCARSRYFA